MKNSLYFYGYPYAENIINPQSGTLLEKRPFPVGVEFRSVGVEQNALFLFQAITGSGSYHYWDNTNTISDFSDEVLDISYAYKTALPDTPLSHVLKYFTKTNIVDY